MLEDGFDDLRFNQAVLEGLSGNCSPSVASFLAKKAPTPLTDGEIHNAWFGAVIRTGCRLSAKMLLQILDIRRAYGQLDWLPLLAKSPPANFGARLGVELRRNIEELARTDPSSDRYFGLGIRLWIGLRTAAELWPNEVPPMAASLLTFPYSYVRFAAADALSSKSPGEAARIGRQYLTDPWVLTGLVKNGWFDETIVAPAIKAAADQSKNIMGHYTAASVMFFLRTVRLHRLTAGEGLVRNLIASDKPEIKLEALRTLDKLTRPRGARERMRLCRLAPSSDGVRAVERVDRHARRTSPPRMRSARLGFAQCRDHRREREKEPQLARRKGLKPEVRIEFRRVLVLGVRHDGENRQGTGGAEDAAQRIRKQQFADPSALHPLVAAAATDQGGRYRVAPRQLRREFPRQIVERQREIAQAVNADHPQFLVDGDEGTLGAALFICAPPATKPRIEFGLTGSEHGTRMKRTPKADRDHRAMSRRRSLTPRRVSWWGRAVWLWLSGRHPDWRRRAPCVPSPREFAARLHRRGRPNSVPRRPWRVR